MTIVINSTLSDFTDRILRGQDAPKEKYLFTVKLVISGGNLNESLCTGTVISKHHVMTAAHCLIFQEWDWFMDIFYSINANNITMIKRDGSTMFSNKFYAGPRFTAKTVLQDIGIVEFVDEIGIEPVALAAEFDEYDGQIAVVLGYGNTTAHRIGPFPGYPEGMIIGINPPKTLQCACIGIRNFKACKEFYESYDNFTMPPMVCAGDRNQGIMSGDSGGPLLLQNITGKWIQVGITSFRQFLFDEHDVYPDAFTRISTHCKWIKKVTKNKSKCETFKPVKLLDDGLFFNI
uniref:Peptidase S1 domain-containing protein n=1 Tax=Panagrolaimus sp. JU765 TaxID=591449 RepID=A0AC34Q4L8_9BILA